MEREPTAEREPMIIGVFDKPEQAKEAVEELTAFGFHDEDVGAAWRGDREARPERNAGEAVATGAVTGGVTGGVVAAAASVLIPGIGPVIAGGVLATALAGAGIGAVTGGVLAPLVETGLAPEDGHDSEEPAPERVIVAVQPHGRAVAARDILRKHGGRDAQEGSLDDAESGLQEESPGAYRGDIETTQR